MAPRKPPSGPKAAIPVDPFAGPFTQERVTDLLRREMKGKAKLPTPDKITHLAQWPVARRKEAA